MVVAIATTCSTFDSPAISMPFHQQQQYHHHHHQQQQQQQQGRRDQQAEAAQNPSPAPFRIAAEMVNTSQLGSFPSQHGAASAGANAWNDASMNLSNTERPEGMFSTLQQHHCQHQPALNNQWKLGLTPNAANGADAIAEAGSFASSCLPPLHSLTLPASSSFALANGRSQIQTQTQIHTQSQAQAQGLAHSHSITNSNMNMNMDARTSMGMSNGIHSAFGLNHNLALMDHLSSSLVPSAMASSGSTAHADLPSVMSALAPTSAASLAYGGDPNVSLHLGQVTTSTDAADLGSEANNSIGNITNTESATKQAFDWVLRSIQENDALNNANNSSNRGRNMRNYNLNGHSQYHRLQQHRQKQDDRANGLVMEDLEPSPIAFDRNGTTKRHSQPSSCAARAAPPQFEATTLWGTASSTRRIGSSETSGDVTAVATPASIPSFSNIRTATPLFDISQDEQKVAATVSTCSIRSTQDPPSSALGAAFELGDGNNTRTLGDPDDSGSNTKRRASFSSALPQLRQDRSKRHKVSSASLGLPVDLIQMEPQGSTIFPPMAVSQAAGGDGGQIQGHASITFDLDIDRDPCNGVYAQAQIVAGPVVSSDCLEQHGDLTGMGSVDQPNGSVQIEITESDKSQLHARSCEQPQQQPDAPPPSASSSRSRSRSRKSSRCKQEARWNTRYAELCRFREQHGHCSVPHCYDGNVQLAQWVKRQRNQYKLKADGRHSTLTPDREKALDSVGFVWDSHQALWDERFQDLLAYKEEHGHCIVPARHKANRCLAVWVKCQRRQYKLLKEQQRSNMSAERIRRLNSVGFSWHIRKSI